MKKFFQNALRYPAAVLALMMLAGCGNKAEENVVKVGASPVMPPYLSYVNGKVDGIEMAVAREILEKNGYKLKITESSFSGLVRAVGSGTFDLGLGMLSISDERRKTVDFTVPYDTMPRVIVSCKKSPLKNLQQMKGRQFNIGVHAATTNRSFAAVKEHTVYEFKDYGTAFIALLYGKIDGVLCDLCVAEEYQVYSPDLIIFPDPLFVDELGMAVSKNQTKLLRLLNAGIREMKENGKLEELKRKFYSHEVLKKEDKIIEE